MKKFLTCLSAAVLVLSLQQGAGQAYENIDLDPAFVSEIEEIFHVNADKTPFDLGLVSGEDPNLHLFQEAEIYITFIHEKAMFKNQFGYFTFDDCNEDGLIQPEEVLSEELIFENVSEEGGVMVPGDTVKIGPFPAGTDLGFFVVADGYDDPIHTYYTVPELNPDGVHHMVMVGTSDGGNVAIGIEDWFWHDEDCDKDFNDVIFTFTMTPETALEEVIEDSDIPVYDPDGSSEEEPVQDPAAEADDQDSLPIHPADFEGFEGEPGSEIVSAEQTSDVLMVIEGSGPGCSLSPSADQGIDLSLAAVAILALVFIGRGSRNKEL
ncbi:MAG TPA: DUF4114 domain-containing protein [bacterium]|nr:DUF4114 domain-containing protein [bacterium]